MTIKKILPLIFGFSIFLSCTDNIDFSQLEDYRVTPEYIGSLVSFSLSPNQFFDETTDNQKFQLIEKSSLRLIESDLMKKKIVKIDFNAEIINEFNNDFTVQIIFFDANNLPTYIFQDMIVSASDINFDFIETIEVKNNPDIKNTLKIKIIITINNPLTVLDSSDLSTELKFKSSLKLYFDSDL